MTGGIILETRDLRREFGALVAVEGTAFRADFSFWRVRLRFRIALLHLSGRPARAVCVRGLHSLHCGAA